MKRDIYVYMIRERHIYEKTYVQALREVDKNIFFLDLLAPEIYLSMKRELCMYKKRGLCIHIEREI